MRTASPDAQRTVSTGELAGAKDEETGAYVWRAIPFAAPPVGDLRWRAPRKPPSWTGVRPALAPAPWCPQVLSALDGVPQKRFGELAGQEDCLYLDVYTPPMSAEAARTTRLPVMMWIHGGSNVWGRAQQYDGATLAAREKVVVVIIQYRLGPLGWFAHDALRAGAETPEDASANFGTLDTIRALEWIRDEIGAFGGDASRVTVFGESAGGHNVAALLASPRARGLFHRAIVQSGAFNSTPLAEAEGTTGDRADSGRAVAGKLLGDAPVTGAALRAVPLAKLFGAYDTRRENFDPPRVIADGVVLPASGIRAALASRETFNAVPVILGINAEEAKLFNVFDRRLVRWRFGVLPVPRDRALYDAMGRYPSRMWRVSAVDEPARQMTASGHADVWTYRFDWDEEGSAFGSDLSVLLGAAHSMEIPFVFGHFRHLGAFDKYAFTEANAPRRLALSAAMMGYWAQFAATGDPGAGARGANPAWTRYVAAPDAPNILALDAGPGGIRMLADHETQARIKAGLFQDLKDDAQRCFVFAAMRRWNADVTTEGAERCAR